MCNYLGETADGNYVPCLSISLSFSSVGDGGCWLHMIKRGHIHFQTHNKLQLLLLTSNKQCSDIFP